MLRQTRCAPGGTFLEGRLFMKMKQPTTYEQQLKLLKSRGCIIDDDQFCIDVLSNVNYYRFSAYFLPFWNSDRITYKSGTTFSQIYCIYEFDQYLRRIVLSEIENIETSLRAKVVYFHAHKYGALGYENKSNFNTAHNHSTFKSIIAGEIRKNKNVLFVKHHIAKYNGKLPIWAMIELFSLGMLSRFYSDLLTGDRKQIALETFGVDESLVRSWLQCCTNLRNICAHYGRLYYRLLGAVPLTPKGFGFTLDRSLFSALVMLKLMSRDKIAWNSTFLLKLQDLISDYSNSVHLQHIGFPNNWHDLLKHETDQEGG
jgi:abortive infection bacteriophage resistance protein